MLRGESRSSNTFMLRRAIIQRAINAPNSRHAIFHFRFKWPENPLSFDIDSRSVVQWAGLACFSWRFIVYTESVGD
ncbi:hypothetical protein [Sphingopyxis sp.]|uniref:hypothetical protein n=1 Tax=Sphingopyxis sp. TaxID=1908224 RepID=UPI001DEF7F7D|nr:hypothetical protein [Sphingopyxis sp.]MBW8295700.1 hypothetical protein [Sphingopyxis sp.]